MYCFLQLVKFNMHLKNNSHLNKFSAKRIWEQMRNLDSSCEKLSVNQVNFSGQAWKGKITACFLLSVIILVWLKLFRSKRLILLWILGITKVQKMDNEYLERSNFLESVVVVISWKRG